MAALFAVALAGCGKRVPDEGTPPRVAQPPSHCLEVEIIDTGERAAALMQYYADGKPYRLSRPGYFGEKGDKFMFCER